MGWKENKFKNCLLALYMLVSMVSWSQSTPLDADQWDKLRQGIDYYEKSPAASERSVTPTPLGLETWYKMLRIFSFGVLIIAIAILIVRIVLNAKMPEIRHKNKKRDEENLSPPNALSTIEELWNHYQIAKNNGDFKECIRTLYQISLKKLADNNWITTRAEKTNMEYIEEIEKGEIADAFIQLTDIHEYSWYGNPNIGISEFKTYEPRFLNFINDRAIEKK